MADGNRMGMLNTLRAALGDVVQGKCDVIDLLLVAFIAQGHVLLEDVPGVGKTTLAKALAQALDLSFNRVQFTPDLLPADILGGGIYNPIKGEFSFRKGPVFCNILLADEINRASPRTQSALLEAMSEGQVTIEGQCYSLPEPFMVIATQNPVEYQGTYPLPEAQLDRFLLQLELGYPDAETEVAILFAQEHEHPLLGLGVVVEQEDLQGLWKYVHEIHVDPKVGQYIVDLVRWTRSDERLQLGGSPRSSLMLFRAARAWALLSGRDHVLPDDVQAVAPCVLGHRLILHAKAKYAGASKGEIIRDALAAVRVPT